MKRLLILFICMFLSVLSAQAAINMKVTAIDEFSTKSPAKTIDVKVREDILLGKYEIKKDDILKCNVIEVTAPKRAKQDAAIYVQPTLYISSGIKIPIEEPFVGKYSKRVLSKEELKNMPKGEIVGKAAVTVGSLCKKGLGQGISLAEGMVKNEEGNRLKSGVKQVYEDSLISYVGKGQEIDIKPADDFYFVFKQEDVQEEPNYTYIENAE